MTLVAASGYEAEASAAAVLMVASVAAFQTATATASAAAAKAYIAEDDAGTETPTNCLGSTLVTTGVWAAVRLGDTRRPQRAWQVWGREGDITVYLHLPDTSGDDAGSIVRRARNLQSAVATGIEALFGSAGALTSGYCETSPVTIDDQTGAQRGVCTAPIIIHWSDLP